MLVNSVQKASWTQNVTTTYTDYINTQFVNFVLNVGDTITYKVSGRAFASPGGTITGPNNYVKLCPSANSVDDDGDGYTEDHGDCN